MAKQKPIVIDGEVREVNQSSKVVDVVPDDVTSIVTHGGTLIPRSEFKNVPVPEGFQTNLSIINKGYSGEPVGRNTAQSCRSG